MAETRAPAITGPAPCLRDQDRRAEPPPRQDHGATDAPRSSSRPSPSASPGSATPPAPYSDPSLWGAGSRCTVDQRRCVAGGRVIGCRRSCYSWRSRLKVPRSRRGRDIRPDRFLRRMLFCVRPRRGRGLGVVDHGVGQAAVRYSLMSPAQVVCRRIAWPGPAGTTAWPSGGRWSSDRWGRCWL
jgi:hypothetical protein